jgi:hypothetical protein
VDDHFAQIRASQELPPQMVEQLAVCGFLTITGPLSGTQFGELTDAYDQAMVEASGANLRIGSTTTRISDVLSFNPVFNEVFLFAPLLEACGHSIGEPFKLSSILGRTIRGGSSAQELHVDLPRASENAPLFGFILMIDPFQEENGATRFVPGSHRWPEIPSDRVLDARSTYPGEIPCLSTFGLNSLVFCPEFVQLEVTQVFDIDHLIASFINCSNEFDVGTSLRDERA